MIPGFQKLRFRIAYAIIFHEVAYMEKAFESISLGGHKVIHFQVTDSTNTQLKQLAKCGEGHGTVIIADEQTNGRGRMDRKWLSNRGQGAWFSCLIRPPEGTVEAYRASDLVFVSALSLALTLRTHDVPALIKWPNDLTINGKKLSGIMCEMSSHNAFLEWAVVGVGVNLLGSQFPPELPWAASVESETGVRIDSIRLLSEFLSCFDHWYNIWLSDGLQPILQQIEPISATIGQRVKAHLPSFEVEGSAVRFQDNGALIIETEEGDVEIAYGDVSVRGILGYT